MGSFYYPDTSYNSPLLFYAGTGIQTYTFLQPSFDPSICMLEPNPNFGYGGIDEYGVDC
jgi:hypothetical protein